MRCFIIYILFLLPFFGKSQSLKTVYEGKTYYSFCVKITKENVKNFSIVENSNNLPHNQYIRSNVHNEKFVSTASVVDQNCLPLGFYTINKQQQKGTNLGNGSGNFYLKPNGAFLVTNNDIVVCDADKINRQQNIQSGIQSGPMLVSSGQINPHFNIGSPNKHIRSGVGVFTNNKGERFVIFSIANEPVSFYEFSLFFINKFNCKDALCIDSARSAMAIPYMHNTTDQSTNTICRYITYQYK